MSNQSQVKTKNKLPSSDVWIFAWKYSKYLILILAILISVSVGLVFGKLSAAFATCLWVLVIAHSVMYFVRMVYSRRFAGHIVMDYGMSILWFLWASYAALVVCFVYSYPQMVMNPFNYFPSSMSYFFAILFYCSIFLVVLSQSLVRLQLRENGINLYDRFVPWDWVESYSWDWGGRMLYLDGKNQMFQHMLLNQPFWIASNHRDIVDDLLRKHLGSVKPG